MAELLFELRDMQKRAAQHVPGRAIVLLKRIFKIVFPNLPSFSLADTLKYGCLGKLRVVVKLFEEVEGFPLAPL